LSKHPFEPFFWISDTFSGFIRSPRGSNISKIKTTGTPRSLNNVLQKVYCLQNGLDPPDLLVAIIRLPYRNICYCRTLAGLLQKYFSPCRAAAVTADTLPTPSRLQNTLDPPYLWVVIIRLPYRNICYCRTLAGLLQKYFSPCRAAAVTADTLPTPSRLQNTLDPPHLLVAIIRLPYRYICYCRILAGLLQKYFTLLQEFCTAPSASSTFPREKVHKDKTSREAAATFHIKAPEHPPSIFGPEWPDLKIVKKLKFFPGYPLDEKIRA
jgi:hypothetical protein